MGAEGGPSNAEEEKEAKRYRSASTTPRSTPGALPHDYDMVMGIAPVVPQESVRFDCNSEFQDVVETAAHSESFLINQTQARATNQTKLLVWGIP